MKRKEAIALLLVLVALALQIGGFLVLRAHYLALFGASTTPPAELLASRRLLWTLGAGGWLSAASATYTLLRYARKWLLLLLAPLCLLCCFLATATIYAMMVIEGWV